MLDVDLGDIDLAWTGAWDITATAGVATAVLRPGATLAGVATLPFLDPPRQVALSGTSLGAGGWRVDGALVGALSAAGLSVTGATVEATLTPLGFSGTVDLDVELAVGTAAPIVGDLVMAWTPTGTQLAGTIRLDGVVADPVARFDGITLQVATTVAGTIIDLVSDLDGSIALFPGVDLVTFEQPTGSLTADGVLTVGAATATAVIAGGIVVTLDAPTITLDPDAVVPSPIITVPSATATIPSLGDISVTLLDLQLMNDGTVRVSQAIADPRAVTDSLGIAGLLPFDVTYVSVAFPDPALPLDRFDATISGSFDFDALGGAAVHPRAHDRRPRRRCRRRRCRRRVHLHRPRRLLRRDPSRRPRTGHDRVRRPRRRSRRRRGDDHARRVRRRRRTRRSRRPVDGADRRGDERGHDRQRPERLD